MQYASHANVLLMSNSKKKEQKMKVLETSSHGQNDEVITGCKKKPNEKVH